MIDFPVVGIGASAGGLDAFRRFFAAAPADGGMAYILIQHLDPTHDSMMVTLLAGHTPMTVRQAVDGMAVERDHVYVIAPGTYLAIGDGLLRPSEPRDRHGARLPFDFFLRSLAEACGERAVAVVLSGTGGDGSLGLRAVRDKGGLVIAQEPEEATFDGMPRSAIATGCVDLVLSVAEIPSAIRSRGERSRPIHPNIASGTDPNIASGINPDPGPGPDPGPDPLPGIIEMLRSRTPHDFSSYREGTLRRRIERRMAVIGITDGVAYLDSLREIHGEIELLAQDLLINVTHFFRDAKAFETLAETVVADLVRTQPADQPLRLWVPGSSTGEEAYSLAMLFLEAISVARRSLKLQVFASDVDKEAVAAARVGLYPEAIKSEVSPERLARFFTREPPGWRVTPELRGVVVFTVQDVLSDPPFSRLDLISCRNLLIYLRPDAQNRVLRVFHFALREGGVLFLGGAETAGGLDDYFDPISKPYRLFRRIGHLRPGEVDFPLRGGARSLWPRPPPRPDAQSPDLGELMRGLVLDAFAPASVLINRRHETLYMLGPTNRYLRLVPGEPSRNLLAMVREGLRTKLRSALRQVSHEQKRVTVTGAVLESGGGRDGGRGDNPVTVSIGVQSVRSNGEELLMVSFIDEPKPEPQPSPATTTTTNAADSARVVELERELESTRGELQNAIHDLEVANEEQKAINEEAMSVNEEFQSTNEELETSKEELQSLNEELTALNTQLQETIEQQRRTANDLQNILNSSDVATLFLDHQLNIRFFTPAIKSLFGVIATDVGRPLSDLARRFEDPDLLLDVQAVLTAVAPRNQEVRTEGGAWYLRRVLPYRGHEGRIEGAVITFADISEIKAAELELQTARAYAESIIDTVQQPLVVLDRDLAVISANRSFFQVFSLDPKATVGQHFAADDAPSGDLPGLRGFLDMVRAAPAPIEDYGIELDLPPLGRRHLMVNARNIQYGSPGNPLILLAIDDITERRRATQALEGAKLQAEQANLGKSRFLSAASHDLRQPLQTLDLLQALLARRVTDVGAVDLVTRFGETLGAMTGMLNTLLDINQLEAGIVQAEIVSFPINDILERLRTEFGYHAHVHELSWRVVGCGSVVRSDPQLLEQIIRNLLSNAMKYTTHGGVLLGCRRRGDRLRIEIWDTGGGIPEAQLQAIFEEFYQLDNAARERSRGLGLGLSIVKRLAAMLGHSVDVHSVTGKGSVFSIEIPIVAFAGPTRRSFHDRSTVVPEAHRGKTIMVVEDDPPTREALHLLFDGEGYRTQTVADGSLALELVARGGIRPDLIVADYNLPGALTGTQLVERLRRMLRHASPAIILTGDISVGTLQEISRQGCRRLSKPVQAAELLRLIHDLLSNPPGPAVPPEAGLASKSGPDAPPQTIFVVDDDGTVRDTLRALLESDERTVETYPSAEAFLDACPSDTNGCLVADAHMPGMSGIELVERLAADGRALPSIVITGFGDVQMAVRAMKAGAVDFIEKPVHADELLASIDRAIALSRDHTKVEAAHKATVDLLASLTERQRHIMDMVLAGYPSKNIASDLGISQRTVENHRAAIMRKTGSKSLPALARLALGLAG